MRVALNLEQCFQRPPGGIGRYVAELARVLPLVDAPAGVEVVPFVARHPAAAVRRRVDELGLDGPVAVLPYPRVLLYELWNRWGAVDPLRAPATSALRGADVVHAPSVAVPPRGGAPLVVTVHDAAPVRFPDTYPARGRRFHALGFAAAADRADAIVAPSAAAADEVAQHTSIPRERIRPIHHGVDHTVATAEEVHTARRRFAVDDRPYVLWVGTLEPRKSVETLVAGYAAAVARHDLPHRLVLVGPDGWLDGQAAAAQQAVPLGERVRFTGAVDPAALRALYAGADLFCLPSRHEGFGMPVLEAMAQGTAVLAADLPVLREVAEAGAEYAPVGDAEAWADALAALVGDDERRGRLAAAGRARAADFTWERCAREHVEVYRSVL